MTAGIGPSFPTLQISLGDARSYFLSTAENELGVVSARSLAGGTLIPISWTEMQCNSTGAKVRSVERVFWGDGVGCDGYKLVLNSVLVQQKIGVSQSCESDGLNLIGVIIVIIVIMDAKIYV